MTPILHQERLPGGWNWSQVLNPGTALRLTDPEGGASVALLAYSPAETSERYSFPDTLKAQFTARLTKGHALYSDMGRILLSILEDSFGGHDPFGGLARETDVAARFGTKTYQERRNGYTRSGELALLTELAKYRLDGRDLVPPLNFFSKTSVTSLGELVFHPEAARPGATVVLQAEMPVLVVLAATQHPLDPRSDWAPRPVDLQVVATRVAPADNPAYAHSDQNRRGFENTARLTL
jgi:urea carboxylase-associated protein 2